MTDTQTCRHSPMITFLQDQSPLLITFWLVGSVHHNHYVACAQHVHICVSMFRWSSLQREGKNKFVTQLLQYMSSVSLRGQTSLILSCRQSQFYDLCAVFSPHWLAMVKSDYLSAIFITTCGINNTESPFSLNNYHKNHF